MMASATLLPANMRRCVCARVAGTVSAGVRCAGGDHGEPARGVVRCAGSQYTAGTRTDHTMSANGTAAIAPRLCHVRKVPNFDGYGFNLHAEKGKPGQYIGKVDEGSPAETAGLRRGDRILEVNGNSIADETHKQVVARIKERPDEAELLMTAAEMRAQLAAKKMRDPKKVPMDLKSKHDIVEKL
ncbi:hypothetical protein NE865_09949 [Phthorimaea operculella]|nr:hypothetical protein NE865_09949 [Phthorimaea operculella]